MPIPISRDGHQWTPNSGLEAGIPSRSVITPANNLQSTEKVYDVVVIGAGYAGLTAARDLSTQGFSVVLIEGRDRIGGRTWSSEIEGYQYEMGGTWVHWTQPFVWRELSRYGLDKELEVSPLSGSGVDKYALHGAEGTQFFTHEEEARIMESAMKKFVNVDGELGRIIVPMAHDAQRNPEFAKYDQMSFADRFKEIEDELTPVERTTFEGFLTITSGGKLEESSFFEMLRWWALAGYSLTQFVEMGLTYKLRRGQTSLARALFDEALSTGNLDYAFNAPIKSIVDQGSSVEIETRDGEALRAGRVVCTVPLNVLHTISFSPPLGSAKLEASKLGHCNHVSKVHVECANPELRTLSAIAYPSNPLTYTFSDGTTSAGNTHLVAFGNSLEGTHLQPEEDMKVTAQAFQTFAPMDIKRIVFHNWHKDEFSQGAWEWLRPGMATKYLGDLRKRQGNILFASADWAIGWRGFIDGAVEDGARAAQELAVELRALRKKSLPN